MAADAGWTVSDYERVQGDYPIRTYLDSLEGRNANDAAALLRQLRARGNQMREPQSKKVEGTDDLFELRGHQVRIFYMFRPGRQIVLLDGVIKKRDRIDSADLKRALMYQQDVKRRGPRAR
jgi:hypothetical protein